MLNRIIRFCVYRPLAVLFATLILAIAGWYNFKTLPIDAVPDVTNNQVQINVEVDGLGTYGAERMVTFPIETFMRGLPGVDVVRSFTRSNLSQITVIFQDHVEIYRARQIVMEALQTLQPDLPKSAVPKLGPISTGLGEIFHYTVEAEQIASGEERVRQLMELKSLQDWFVKPRLRSVAGVANVNTIGGYERQYHVQPNSKSLAKYGLDIPDLIMALEKTNRTMGAGHVNRAGNHFLVQATRLLQSVDDIRNVPVGLLQNFKPISIGQVADVKITTELRTGAALVDGHEAVVGTVMMLSGANSKDVAARVDEKLREIGKELPPGFKIRPLYNRSELVDHTLGTLKHSLITGAALVTFILFLLIGNLRAALITAVIIPISLLMTFIGMKKFGISGNLMSLGALDFGIIVDGTVILLDHCVRVIQEKSKSLARPLNAKELKDTVYKAAVQIRTAAGFGELIIIVVFLPVFSFENVEGKTFHPMAATFIIALLSALILSFTTAPALAGLLLSGDAKDQEPWIMRKIEHFYTPILSRLLKLKKIVIAIGILSVLLGLALFTQLGGEFLPTLDEESILIECVRPIKISLPRSVELQSRSDLIAASFPEVRWTFSKIGTSEIASDPQGFYRGDLYIMLKPHQEWPLINGRKRTKAELVDEMIRKFKKEIPEQMVMPNQPIQNRFNDLLGGTRGDIAIKIFGDDLDQLAKLTMEVQSKLLKVQGVGEIGLELLGQSQMLRILPHEKIIRDMGISIADVFDAIEASLGGYEVGYIYDGFKRFPLMIRLKEEDRSNLDVLENFPIGFSQNGTVPLKELASFQFEEYFSEVKREDGSRRATISLNTHGRDIESFVKEARGLIEREVQLPPGYSIKWGGTYESLQKAKQRLVIVMPMALALIIFMVYWAFGNLIQTILIFLCIPLALVGGIVGLMLNHLNFSISAGVGFIALSGIAVLNGVVMINYFNELHSEGLSGEALIKKGTILRLRPVLMTALVDILGFLPMMLATGAGSEIQRPLASVIIGGIITSTLLTLVVLPIMYSIFENKIIESKKNRT